MGGGGVSGTSDTATASLEAWGLGHLTSLHTQEGSQQQWQEEEANTKYIEDSKLT